MTNLNATSVVDPVKIILERHVHPGAESAFQGWAERYVAAARRFPGHQGSSVLSTASGGSHFILLRFASSDDLDAWQRSAEATAFLREADAVSAAGPSSQVRSGLETWFTLPGMPTPSKPPAKWKMAILTWAALLPMVIGLAYVFAPFQLPFLPEVMLSTAIPVVMLTWVIMPRATGWFYRWLYPHEAHV
jgi:uncharacterized protein